MVVLVVPNCCLRDGVEDSKKSLVLYTKTKHKAVEKMVKYRLQNVD